MRLGGYTRAQGEPWWASLGIKGVVLVLAVVANLGALLWWTVRNQPAYQPDEREYVKYYDIAPLTEAAPPVAGAAAPLPVEPGRP
jgi:hypothetical protein